jgi:spectrin alpha
MTDIGDVIDGKEIQVLETAEDIQARREQVLTRFAHFKEAAKYRRDKLEDSREYQYFKRDADELEMWINEKIQLCSHDDTYRDTTSVQVKKKKFINQSQFFNSHSFRLKFKNMKLLKKK